MSEARRPALRCRDLVLGYGRRPAVVDLSGTVHEGDLLAVVGPNGAGKSTFLKGIVGESRVLGGTLDLCGRAVPDLAYLSQRNELDLAFPIEVFDFVAMGSWRRLGPFRRADAAELGRVTDAIARVSLAGFERRPIGTLSGGQMQRALFARTVVQDASLILLDEPFTAVDERTTADLVELIAGWHGEGRTVVATLHDMALVRAKFPLTLLLAREPIAWGPTETALTPDNLARSRSTVAAWAAARERADASIVTQHG